MTQAGIPASRAEASDRLPEFGDEASKVVYPAVREGEDDRAYVKRAVNGRYSWLLLLLVAALCFGVFIAATVSAVDLAIAHPEQPPKEKVVDK